MRRETGASRPLQAVAWGWKRGPVLHSTVQFSGCSLIYPMYRWPHGCVLCLTTQDPIYDYLAQNNDFLALPSLLHRAGELAVSFTYTQGQSWRNILLTQAIARPLLRRRL